MGIYREVNMINRRFVGPVLLALLLVSVFFPAEIAQEAKAASNQVSLDVRNADLRDVLSALAIQTNTNIVLIEEPIRITFAVDNVSPMKALELLLQSEGLSYIRDGNLLVVGRQEKLQANYFVEETLTRFDLVYIRTEQFRPLLSELDLPVKSIVMDNNPYTIWVQGTPEILVKVKELLEAVDQFENAIFQGEEELILAYKEFNTFAVEPARLAEMARRAGVPLDQYITLGNRMLVFDQQLLAHWDDFEHIMMELDTIEARNSSVFPYQFKHVVARDGASRLAAIGYPGVSTITYNFPEFSQGLIVICPPELESQVYAALATTKLSNS
jgi:type IV pilus assembly protein PilQ